MDRTVLPAAERLPKHVQALTLSDRLHQLLKILAASAAITFIVMYVVIALHRMSYPFALEWLEGGCVDMVRQVLSPEPLYVAPSLSYMPFVYAPLYFYVSAPITQLMGVGFLPLRLLSFISSLGCFVLLCAIANRESGSPFAGLMAAGLFAATYVWTGGWFDLARVDSMFLFLLLAAIYVLRNSTGLLPCVGAAVLMWLAFLTKQVTLAIAVPLFMYAVVTDKRTGLVSVGTFATLVVVSTLLLDVAYQGWYTYYVFDLPAQHPLVMDKVIGFWLADIAAPLFVACAFSAVLTVSAWRTGDRTRALFYIALLAGVLGGAWFSRLHQGGYSNVLMPAYAALALLFGIAAARIPRSATLSPRFAPKTMSAILVALCLLQFASLSYNPSWMVPSAKERAASESLISAMKHCEGEVFAPSHGYTPTLAGKQTYAHTVAIWDILRGDDGVMRATIIGELRGLTRTQRFDMLVLESPTWVLPDLPQYYRFSASLPQVFESETVMWPQAMKLLRPEGVYLPVSHTQVSETTTP